MPIYLQHGNLIDYVPPTDTSTEDVVFMGGLVGIPQTFIPAGELGALSVDGVYMFSKKDGVSVNLGEVVKYCGTTKLAQDSNADLPLGVAVADADADDFGVKVKINSVLPTDGGGGGGGEVALCGSSGLYLDYAGNVAIKYCGNSAINADTNGVYLAVCGDSGLSIQNGELVASGGGGGGGGGGVEVSLCGDSGLFFDGNGNVAIKYCGDSAIKANSFDGVYLALCTASGLSIQDGELVASGGGEVAIDTSRGLSDDGCGVGINIGTGLKFDSCGEVAVYIGRGLDFSVYSGIAVKIGDGLSFGSNGELTAAGGGGEILVNCGLRNNNGVIGININNATSGLDINDYGLTLKVCTASGLSIDSNGYLTYNG